MVEAVFCLRLTLRRLAESGATSSEERGPVEIQPGRKAETDRVREGISEGFHPAESERVAPGDEDAIALVGRLTTSLKTAPRTPSAPYNRDP